MVKRKSIINSSFKYATVDVFPGAINDYITLTNPKKFLCHVFEAPSGSDIEVEGVFRVPNDYDNTPQIIVGGYFVGTPANTFAVGFEMIARALSENLDTAFETADLANNSTWTGYVDKDYYELAISLTATIAKLDQVAWKFFRDDSVDTQTQRFLMSSLEFAYADS